MKPLERFLEKSVGRNWNKVYSEIRERIDPRRAIGLHVLQHLDKDDEAVKQLAFADVILLNKIDLIAPALPSEA